MPTKPNTETLLEIAQQSGDEAREKVLRFRFRLHAARFLSEAATRLLSAGTDPDKQLEYEILDLLKRIPEEP